MVKQASSVLSPGGLVSNLSTVQVIVLVLGELLHGLNRALHLVSNDHEVPSVGYKLVIGLKCGSMLRVLVTSSSVLAREN